MKLLALDTASDACTAALAIDDDIIERYAIAPRGHSQLILPMVDELLAQAGISLADVDALAFGRGPGSFTGLRIAVGVAQGIAFGADLPVVPVSSLAALAQGTNAEQVLVAVDARMHEVYWGVFQRNAQGLMEACSEECVCPPAEVTAPPGDEWSAVGSGWASHNRELTDRFGGQITHIDTEALPHARDVARLGIAGFKSGVALRAEQALPVYLRDEVAWKKITD